MNPINPFVKVRSSKGQIVHSYNIAVVEDDTLFAAELEELLVGLGYTVKSYGSAQKFLTDVRQKNAIFDRRLDHSGSIWY